MKFVDQVRELGIDDATKLFSAARRTRKHVGTEAPRNALDDTPAAPSGRGARTRETASNSALKRWDPIGRDVTAPVSPRLNRSSSVENTYRHVASNTSAQWPASFSADAHAAKFGSSGSGSDLRDAVTRARLPDLARRRRSLRTTRTRIDGLAGLR